MTSLLRPAAALLCASLAATAHGQPSFRIFTDFDDTNYQGAFGLSGDGSTVVGFARRNGTGWPDAVRWNADGSFDHLGLGNAWSTSYDGATVATENNGAMWRFRGDELIRLTMPDGSPRAGTPHAMSSDGEWIAGLFRNEGRDEAFLWSEGSGLVGLGLGNGYSDTGAYGMSPDATVIVGEADLGSGQHFGFRWTADRGYELLRGDNNSEPAMLSAFDTSADGGVIVGRANTERAGYWTEQTGTVSFPALQPHSTGYSFGVTPDGSMIVGTDIDSGDEIAFLWTPDDGIRPLQQVLLEDYALDLGDFHLDRATGISDDGLTITGIGHHDGSSLDRAWRVTIPTPATCALLALAALATPRRR